MEPRIVMKFGGVSIGTAERMKSVVEVIRAGRKQAAVAVAISAMSSQVKAEGTTSLLLAAVEAAMNNANPHRYLERIKEHHYDAVDKAISDRELTNQTRDFFVAELVNLEHFLHAIGIIKELSPRSYDAVVSVGERLSAKLLTSVLVASDIPADYVDLSDVCPEGATAPDRAFWDQVQEQIGHRTNPILEAGRVPVLTGYLGPVPGGIIGAVGRGYTDHTAALAAAAIQADELQIWKEVDGVFTTDPKKVPAARALASLTPREAAELTYFGSEVVHPMTMERAIRAGIPLRIKNTFRPEIAGTVITEDAEPSPSPVKCVTAKRNITVLNIESNRMLMAYGFMAKLFRVFEEYGVVIDLISTSEVNVSLTIEKAERLPEVVKELAALGDVTVARDMAIVSVVGQQMKRHVGLAARMFRALAEAGINIEMISQGASEINISCVIANNDADRAVRVLHAEFIEKEA